MIPQRYDLSNPANQAKLDAADALAQLAEEAGISLIHMALAFVVSHPAITAAIIGPRTMEQLESQLGAAEVQLDTALLDRIDEIVAPGQDHQPNGRRVDESCAGRSAPPQVGRFPDREGQTARSRWIPAVCGKGRDKLSAERRWINCALRLHRT